MNCEDVINLLPAYIEQKLPEHTFRIIQKHLRTCEACRSESIIWRESQRFFQKDSKSFPQPSASVLQEVMARITAEEKWSLPAARRSFSLSKSTKRWITSFSVLLLIVFGIMMVGAVHMEDTANSGWRDVPVKDLVMSIDKIQASPGSALTSQNIKAGIVASIGEPILFTQTAPASVPNLGLIAAFFGIMIIVVGLNWLSRS